MATPNAAPNCRIVLKVPDHANRTRGHCPEDSALCRRDGDRGANAAALPAAKPRSVKNRMGRSGYLARNSHSTNAIIRTVPPTRVTSLSALDHLSNPRSDQPPASGAEYDGGR
jgi:hypothetical protein